VIEEKKLLLKRRTFVIAAASAVIYVIGVLFNKWIPRWRTHQAKQAAIGVELGALQDFQLGANVLSLARVVLYKEQVSDGKFSLAAISMVCTHQTCLVNSDSPEKDSSDTVVNVGGFTCPCHGSRFSRTGEVLRGPATRPLPWYRLELDLQGKVRLFPQQVVDSTWRLVV